jgi:tRNA threonylcarbamoyladenosine biosynthesis protein TsaE
VEATIQPAVGGRMTSSDVGTTRAIGRSLGSVAVPGTVLALRGPLGAGKTQLAKGVAEGLGVRSVVNSPTFILMNEHEGRLRLYHVDAYRIDDPEEALAAGLLDEREADGVTVIEWADRLAGWLPVERIEIDLEPLAAPDERAVTWRAIGETHVAMARRTLVVPSPGVRAE